ncbi:MAG TPA: CPBP family intramembrane metalloprotease [Anaerolineae bacterium]|nr:CPBP family intramembrane metalloprotease [Anaerolineae bacterium]HQI87578.1 CPBP family intramembrane metalloprotease [Anaerolineae bacterium]
MEIPIMLIIFSLPSIIYIIVQAIRGMPFSESRKNVGWTLCTGKDVLYAAVVFAILAILAFIALKFIPASVLEGASSYAGQPRNVRSILAALIHEAFYIALGEEVFFRGFLGSWLFRRLGFRWGNLVQATVFLLPHLFLLAVSPQIWPVFIIQFCAGWGQGWLQYKSGSIVPSWFVHTATNLVSAISFMG